jgi:hypothetical protein
MTPPTGILKSLTHGIVQHFILETGIPPHVLDENTPLNGFPGIAPGQLADLLRDLERRTDAVGFFAWTERAHLNRPLTIQQIAEKLVTLCRAETSLLDWIESPSDHESIATPTPLLENFLERAPDSAVALLEFDPIHDPFLSGHRYRGVPILPAVIGIEAAAEAASLLTGQSSILEVRDINLFHCYRMPGEAKRRAELAVLREGSVVLCQLSGEPGGHDALLYQSMSIATGSRPAILPRESAIPPRRGWLPIAYAPDWKSPPPEPTRSLYYGPALRCLTHIAFESKASDPAEPAPAARHNVTPSTCWAQLVVQPDSAVAGRRNWSGWRTPAALLDGALVICDMLASHLFGSTQLPSAIDSLRFGRPPRTGESCLTRVVCSGRDGRDLHFDLWLSGEDGALLIHARGIRFVDRAVSWCMTTSG